MTFKVVAFCGPAGSGKDTCHQILAELGVVNPTKIALAGTLKNLCSEFFRIPMNYFEDRDLKEKPFDYSRPLTEPQLYELIEFIYAILPYDRDKVGNLSKHIGVSFRSPRHLLQYVGTDIIRNTLDVNWHLRAAFSDPNKKGVFAVTDCRFVSEAQFIKDFLGDNSKIFFVDNPRITVDLSHPSEAEVLKVKDLSGVIRIDNSGDLNDLRLTIAKQFLSNAGDLIW
jgi:hypothetical protein